MNPTQRQTAEGILFTDAYQLSMAHLNLRMGLHEKPVQFDHFFRIYDTHESGFYINAGLERAARVDADRLISRRVHHFPAPPREPRPSTKRSQSPDSAAFSPCIVDGKPVAVQAGPGHLGSLSFQFVHCPGPENKLYES